MKISKFLVAAILLTAVGASAQTPGGADLQPGQKAETDGDTFNTNPVTMDDVKTFNSNMDTNFTPPTGGGKPGGKTGGKTGDGKTSDGKPGGGNPGGGTASSGIKLSGVTGEVKIKTAGGTMTVKAGEPIPEVPAGAEIIVVSGDVTVAVGGTTIKAGAGDSFTVTPSGSGSASIAVTGGLVAVSEAGGAPKDLAKGESLTVSTAGTPATTTQTTTAKKTEEKKADPESIPADNSGETSGTTTNTQTSVTQESANTTCVNTVSPSAPCP